LKVIIIGILGRVQLVFSGWGGGGEVCDGLFFLTAQQKKKRIVERVQFIGDGDHMCDAKVGGGKMSKKGITFGAGEGA